ncbi:MAG: DNA primase [Candidatus Diapherotrites archaeon]|nr:DNA primase [Candidatus Diapherotrites archaeon]
MAKTYLNTTKYLVKITFEVQGVVDKQDIIGAVFGQSEGLLGEEMDLKELQKNGKIGRIEVFPTTDKGVTAGELHLPSSLDAAQTALLAAAVESVDKVGPCEAKFVINSMEDTRSKKREEVKDRAKSLLSKFLTNTGSTATQLSEELRENARTLSIKTYGKEKLPAGPEIDSSDEIIVVEGRADVINLIKNSYGNVIAMNGSQIPQTIIDLSKAKTITLFIDGDRGGELNARKAISLGKFDFVAKAPDGKEVEELVRKEINQALAKKITVKEFMEEKRTPRTITTTRTPRTTSTLTRTPRTGFSSRTPRTGFEPRNSMRRPPIRGLRIPREPIERASPEEVLKFKPVLESLQGTLKAKIFNKEMKEIKEIQVRDLVNSLPEIKEADSIVFDGIITKRLAEQAETQNISYLIGVKKGSIKKGKTKTLTM